MSEVYQVNHDLQYLDNNDNNVMGVQSPNFDIETIAEREVIKISHKNMSIVLSEHDIPELIELLKELGHWHWYTRIDGKQRYIDKQLPEDVETSQGKVENQGLKMIMFLDQMKDKLDSLSRVVIGAAFTERDKDNVRSLGFDF